MLVIRYQRAELYALKFLVTHDNESEIVSIRSLILIRSKLKSLKSSPFEMGKILVRKSLTQKNLTNIWAKVV